LTTTIAIATLDQAAGKRDVEHEQAIAWEFEDSSLRIGGLFIDPGESPSTHAMNLALGATRKRLERLDGRLAEGARGPRGDGRRPRQGRACSRE
jgi:hypothetical protein